MIWLLDTNVLSVFSRRRDPKLVEQVQSKAEDCLVSCVSWFELEYGAIKRPDIPSLRVRLSLLKETFPEPLPFDEDAAFHAAGVRTVLEIARPNASPIGPYDVLLAGHALSVGAILVTGNVREFSRVPGLRVENWQSGR
jgi:tRNA(fMet)-specific endonuclease VapC